MGKVIFTISYNITPEKRAEYLTLTQEMKAHLAQRNKASYSIYEQKGKKNSFTEIFIFSSMTEYDQLEDQDDQTTSYMTRLESLLANGKMKYSTLVEVE
jgi:antibiotic biosynthesis monooxygenase (ABM) superfamily enzyme